MRMEVKKAATLLEILQQAFPESSRTHLKKMIRYGCVRVMECKNLKDGIVRHPEYLLNSGWHVEVRKYQERDSLKERPPFRILFEDEYILAVYKPAGILSSGRTTEKVRSMFGMVNSYVVKSTRGKQRAYTVHRLDREVSGILLFAQCTGRNYIQKLLSNAEIKMPDTAWNTLQKAWIAFFATVGVINLVVAYTCSTDTWVNFKLFGLMGLTLIFTIGMGFWIAKHVPSMPE